MPKGLLSAGNVQVDYLAARGNGKLYLALTNQSPEPVKATLRLNPALAAARGVHAVKVWRQNQPAAPAAMRDGVLAVEIAGSGITALAIDRVEPATAFQRKFLAGGAAWRKDAVDIELARGHARLIDFGPELQSVYFYVEETGAELKSVTLRYSTGGEWKAAGDTSFPYEFTIPLAASDRQFRFSYEVTRRDGATARSEETILER